MNSKQIEQCLGFLGQKLADMQIKATILILGGAVMVTQIGNRRTTQDIDAIIATNDPATYRAVQQAIKLVTQEKKLASVWLNDDVTIVVDQIGRPRTPKLWKTFANLNVYVPELEYILALKLFSGRERDELDIKALAQRLQITTKKDAWAIVSSYIPAMQITMRREHTDRAINQCFAN